MNKYRAIENLYAVFGRKFNEQQADLWLNELARYSTQAVIDAVDYIKRYSDTFPSLAKVLEATRSMEDNKDVEIFECDVCDGTGRVTIKRTVILGEDIKAQQDFSYRCICHNAKRYPNFKQVQHGWLQNKVAPTVFETDEEAIDLTKEET